MQRKVLVWERNKGILVKYSVIFKLNVVFYKDILLCSMYRKWQIEKEANKAKQQKSEEERGGETRNKLANLKTNHKCVNPKKLWVSPSFYTSINVSSHNACRQQ